MKKKLILMTIIFQSFSFISQTYYPPNMGNSWDTLSPSTLGWCQPKIDSLYAFLDSNNTDAFIILKDGKIVLEKYFGSFTMSTLHAWNSAGKTLIALTVGIAQEENFLDISDTTSDYLGVGWTSLTPTQEEKITIRNQLTMTTGLDDGGTNFDCVTPTCLTYLADVNTRWAYHNGPYTLLSSVLENATGQTVNSYVTTKIKQPTGMNGSFVNIGNNKIYYSNARSFARFGLLLASNASWNGTPILSDMNYFNEMTNSSQNINQSYGYLTWLNGKSSYILPQSQTVFNGPIAPNAPFDMYAALGKDGQIINVVPSQNLVVIRMGSAISQSYAPNEFNDSIWIKINDLSCTANLNENLNKIIIDIFPNPAKDYININGLLTNDIIEISDLNGRKIMANLKGSKIDISNFQKGVYFLSIFRNSELKTIRFIVN